MASASRRNTAEEIRRADQRWLMIAVVIFAISVGGVLALRGIYRATGPHPQVAVFLRRAKLYANSLLRQGRLRPASNK